MATSGSYNFTRTAGQIITAAFENLEEIIPGGTVPSGHSTMALARLNMIAKQYQGTADGSPGVKIHSRQRVTLFLSRLQQQYVVGPLTNNSRATTQYGRTTSRAAEAAGQTALDITARTDTTTYPGTTVTMLDSDVIGVQTDDSTGDDIFWSTISSSSATGPVVTLADALPTGRPAAVGNYVWWFKSRAQRFPVIESAVLRNSSLADTELDIYRDIEEYELGVVDKYADGQPTAILVEPLRIATRITLNSQPTDVTSQILMTVLYPSEDYDATGDEIAYPQEAFRFLSWELAFELAPGVGADWTSAMEKLRMEARASYLSLNPEKSVVYFCPGPL